MKLYAEIAIPAMMVCLITTRLEVDDAAHSTVAYQEIRGCAICDKAANGGKSADCPEPPWMDEARKLAATINKAELAKVKPKAPKRDARK